MNKNLKCPHCGKSIDTPPPNELSEMIDKIDVAESFEITKQAATLISFNGKTGITPSGRRFSSVEEMTQFYTKFDQILWRVKSAYINGGLGWYTETKSKKNDKIKEIPDNLIIGKYDGCDSLDVVEFCMSLEEEFGFDIPDEVIESFEGKGLSGIAEAIYNHLYPSPDNTYNQGYARAFNDFINGKDRHYMNNDENSADSKAHENYIIGYNAGWSAAQAKYPNVK